jgi:uncharacterized coiled-coil DUF342 family protein
MMKLLATLDKKIENLIVLIKELRSHREQLVNQNKVLKEKVTLLENSLLEKNENVQEWNDEKAATRKIVDGLISDIDSLIKDGSQ